MVGLMVDVSNYTGEISDDTIRRWKDRGVLAVMVQAIKPPPAYPKMVEQQQAEAVLRNGLALGVYGFHWTGTQLMNSNVARFDSYGYPVWRYCGDFEDISPADAQQRADEIREQMLWLAINTKSSRSPWSYTGKWYVDGYLPDGTDCMKDFDQWLSNYDHDETIRDLPVAGATRVASKQHWGEMTFEGQSGVDLSVLSYYDEMDVRAYLGLDVHVDPPTEIDPNTDRETPLDWPWPTWYEAALNYKGIADALGQQLAAAKCARMPKA